MFAYYASTHSNHWWIQTIIGCTCLNHILRSRVWILWKRPRSLISLQFSLKWSGGKSYLLFIVSTIKTDYKSCIINMPKFSHHTKLEIQIQTRLTQVCPYMYKPKVYCDGGPNNSNYTCSTTVLFQDDSQRRKSCIIDEKIACPDSWKDSEVNKRSAPK